MGLKVNSHLGVRRIGDTLTFYAETTDSTGLAVDADAVPGYRIYEEETGTAIATGGTMALLDSANTAGLYSEQITLASATGYEFNKDYVIYVTATVAGIASADIYTFKIGPETALFSGLASAGAAGSITLAGAVATDDLYNGCTVAILSGAGAGQARVISDYVGATLVATVIPNWITNPGATSVYAIFPYGQADVQQWREVQPNALIAGRVDSNMQALLDAVITAAKFAAGAIDANAIAADAIGASEFAQAAADKVWATAARTLTAATNITSTGGTVPISAAGLVRADAERISDDASAADNLEAAIETGGSNTVPLRLTQLSCINAAGDAILAQSSGGGGHGINAIGNAAGDGIRGTGGATNDSAGISGQSAAANGYGIKGDGAGTRSGIQGGAGLSGHGILGIGGATSGDGIRGQATGDGQGVQGIGGATAGNSGIVGDSGVSGHGIKGVGNGVGSGILGVGGATDGNGIEGVADAGASAAQGHGVRGAGGATADGSGASFAGAGNGHGLRTVGAGSGEGWSCAGGATGHGAEFAAGGGDRSGIVLTPTGNGTPFSANAGFIRSGAAQAGGASTITLDAAASAVNDFYKGALCHLSAGTGAGQTRTITAYDGTTKIATVAPAWTTAPALSTTFDLLAFGATTAAATADVNVVQISGDGAAADALESILDGGGGTVTANITGNLSGSVGSVAAGGITASSIATDAVDADAIAASAVAEIQAGLATAAALALVQADTDDIQTRLPAALVGGRMDSSVGAMAAGVVTAAAIATDAIDADAIAASAVTEIQAGLATAAALATVQADTDDIQTRLPAALVGGRMDSSVGAMAANVITAAALAADAGEEIIASVSGLADAGSTALTIVDAARTEADVDYWKDMILLMVTGSAAGQARRISAFNPATDTMTLDTAFTQAIAAGDQYLILRTAIFQAAVAGATDWTAGERSQIRQALGVTGAVAATDGTGDLKTLTAAIQADTDDLQTRIPASLSGGRMRSQVEGMDAGTVTAAAIATDAVDGDAIAASAVAEIQAGLATAAGVAGVQADTDDIQTRLPAALVGGRMDSSVGAMGAGVITATAIATGAIDADALAADAVDEIVDQNWNELIAGHLGAGSTGEALNNAAAGGAADWTAGERSQIRQALGVTGAVVATDGTGDLKTLAAAIQADTDDLQARVPATLNAGRMRSHVEACDPPCAPAGGGATPCPEFTAEEG